MKLKPGLSTVSTILRNKRFSHFLHPNDLHGFLANIYVVATFLDLEHRIVLSNDQKRYAESAISKLLKEPMVSSNWLHLIFSITFTAWCRILKLLMMKVMLALLDPLLLEPTLKKFCFLSQMLIEQQDEDIEPVEDRNEVDAYMQSKPNKSDE